MILRILFLALIALINLACDEPVERINITIGSDNFRVEVARTTEQRQRGLMFRKKLKAGEGMLFVFPADQYLAFWMKDTHIPLSIAFLAKDGEILQIEDLKPLSLRTVRSRRSARYALEVPQGSFRDLDVEPGHKIGLPADFR